ncbi:MAG: ABC transporter ATP-binding protein [Spirochaetia bacterium]|nr:ABC transporter ATP-binding protein [Spirochaetia bacterium]
MEKSVMLVLADITKKYGSLYANKDISLQVDAGEVYCILGENGAGKSTLMNVLYGLTQPDHGKIFIEGAPVAVTSPKVAIAHGIGMVHQHFMLIPALTVLENIILASNEVGGVFFDRKQVALQVDKICKAYGFDIDPFLKVSDLTVGQQQKVEIIKALYHNCQLLILDEPTAVLTPQEIEELFIIMKRFKEERKSIIFISHKLQEVMQISDRIGVLRNGSIVSVVNKSDTDEQELACLMVGRHISMDVERPFPPSREKVLDIHDLQVRGRKATRAVHDLSLTVHAGEIYGIAGVDGNGQSELINAITGLVKTKSGEVSICGQNMTNKPVCQILRQGVSHIPEDRQHVGLMMQQSILKNLMIHECITGDCQGFLIDWEKERTHVSTVVDKYNIKIPGLQSHICCLSGGNQQKAVVARELEKEPKLLIAVHPTRGVDVGAIAFIRKQIMAARNRGCAVLLVSFELDEILALSDRIGVIFDGNIIGEMTADEASVNKIGMLMAGVSA